VAAAAEGPAAPIRRPGSASTAQVALSTRERLRDWIHFRDEEPQLRRPCPPSRSPPALHIPQFRGPQHDPLDGGNDPFNLYTDGVTNMRPRLAALPRSMLLEMIETFGLNPAGKTSRG